jgi:hypothetical protein
MPILATEAKRFSNAIKKELWPEDAFCRLVVTVNEAAAKSYTDGMVLGKVTAGGKYKLAVQTASDGSQTADAIVIGQYTVPATTDTKVLVLVKGPAIVAKGGLILDVTYDLQGEKDAVYAALEAKGIQCNDSI